VLAYSCEAGLFRNSLGRVILPFLYAFSTQSLKTQQSSNECLNTLWYGQKLGLSDLSSSSERLLAGRARAFFTAPLKIWATLSLLKEYGLVLFCFRVSKACELPPGLGLGPLL
jgi:hypothetical protein